MCAWSIATRLSVKSQNTAKEDTMHPDIATQLAEFRHADLVAEAAHQRLVRQAKQARADHGRRPRVRRTWRRLLVLGRA
jgi:hypothetical protein